jgi:trimeric autotransporter adhesin
MKTIVKSISRSHSRCGFFIVAVALCWFALSPALKAGCPSIGGCGNANTAVGDDALFNVSSGVWNVGVGFQALSLNTTGNQNTGIGYQALFSNLSGDHSTAIGGLALSLNTTGSDNVGVGFQTLSLNTTGNRNTGMGYRTLAFNSTNSDNTAIGWNALFNNRNIDGNTAVGSSALFTAVNSPENVAVGFNALQATSGTNGFNVAVGFQALDEVTTGGQNTAVGDNALGSIITGTVNTALGDLAGVGHTGSDSGNIDIGAFEEGVPGESFITRIGNITGTPFTTGGFFLYEVNGAIGVFTSSRKFKDDIKPIDKASETIYSLDPVTFRAKPGADPSRPRGYGLIAEDVEKVNPDLVSHGQNDILTVRYESINAMLLNEFLKEHKKVEKQQASISDLKSTVALQQREMQVLTAQLKEQAAQIQKVSAQLQTTKPALRAVAINP